MVEIYAISNQKGGVAKTTTCLSLGASLAEKGQSVLIVDMDSQADLTLAAGLNPDQLDRTVVDMLMSIIKEESPTQTEAVYRTSMEGLDLLPSDVRLAGLETRLYSIKRYEYMLKSALESFDGRYDSILIDCPPSLSAVTLMALTAADLVLIPTQCEYYAARGLERLLDIVEQIRKETNPGLSVRILPVMYDRRNRIHQVLLEKMKAAFPDRIMAGVVGVDVKLKEAPVQGEPITMYAGRARSAKQYRAVADELLQHSEQNRMTT